MFELPNLRVRHHLMPKFWHSFASQPLHIDEGQQEVILVDRAEPIRADHSELLVLGDDDVDDSAFRSVCRPHVWSKQSTKENDTQNAIYKSVSEIDSGLPDSAFSFHLFFQNLFNSVSLASASLPSVVFFCALCEVIAFLVSLVLILATSSWACSLFFVSLGFDHLALLPNFTELNFLSEHFCCSFSATFQHLLWLSGVRNLLHHTVNITFFCFDLLFFLLPSVHVFHEGKDLLNLDLQH